MSNGISRSSVRLSRGRNNMSDLRTNLSNEIGYLDFLYDEGPKMNDFLEIVKNLMVIVCLCATLCSTCRQEQANDRMSAEIMTLKNVSEEIRECGYTGVTAETTTTDEANDEL